MRPFILPMREGWLTLSECIYPNRLRDCATSHSLHGGMWFDKDYVVFVSQNDSHVECVNVPRDSNSGNCLSLMHSNIPGYTYGVR